MLTMTNDDDAPSIARLRSWLSEEIDGKAARLALAASCFISGFIACVSFSACSLWVGFQTGNAVQVGMAISRLAYSHIPEHRMFFVNDYQALTSLVSFVIAAQIGGRLSPWGRKTRCWILLSSATQMLLTICAAVAIHMCREEAFSYDRSRPSWHNAAGFAGIALLSASFGLQGVLGESMGTGFTATVVLTSLYTSLSVLPWPRKWSPPRDDRILCIFLFMFGSFISRLILTTIGSANTLAVAAGLRGVIFLIWISVRPTEEDLDAYTAPSKPGLALYPSHSSASSSATAV